MLLIFKLILSEVMLFWKLPSYSLWLELFRKTFCRGHTSCLWGTEEKRWAEDSVIPFELLCLLQTKSYVNNVQRFWSKQVSKTALSLLLLTTGNLEWMDKNKTRCLIMWRRPEEWGKLIYQWVSSPYCLHGTVKGANIYSLAKTFKVSNHLLQWYGRI